MPKHALATFGLLLLAATTAQAAGEFYCCPDPVNGRRICSDRMPEQCRGRAYSVLDRSGNLVKEVGPPLTQEQKAEQATEARRNKLIEEQAREQRRKDQALLDTYATPMDIDLAQTKAENDVKFSITTAQEAINEATEKRRKLEAEAEFYKKKTMPSELAKELRTVEHEIRLQQEIIDSKKRDFETIKAKYGADRQRYTELTGRTSPASRTKPPTR